LAIFPFLEMRALAITMGAFVGNTSTPAFRSFATCSGRCCGVLLGSAHVREYAQ